MNSIGISLTQTGIVRHVTRAAGIAVSAVALFAAFTAHADAASFQCRHNQSGSEKLVCNDPELSAMDDKLAALYARAKDIAPDRDALEADRVAQWHWRQEHCTDKECVANWYSRRITELDADIQQGQVAQVSTLKANLTAQHLPADAQEAVMKIKSAHAATTASKPAPQTTAAAGTATNQ